MEIKNLSEIREAVAKIEKQKEAEIRKIEIPVDLSYMTADGVEIEVTNNEYAEMRQLKRFLKYTSLFKELTDNENTRKLVKEAREELNLRYEKVDKMVNEDLDELEKCLNVKAYKSVLIMAGSVLEAILLDWLSEKDGKDYFTTPYVYNGQKTIKLEDYINAIPELKTPDWMNTNTHEIRKKRNLVHAKLQLKADANIDAEMCSAVIGYLNDVIKKRRESNLV